MKSICKKIESNIYTETRCGACRFVVAVHPLPKESATFSNFADGLLWARQRRVALFEQKAVNGKLPDADGRFIPAPYRQAPLLVTFNPEKISLKDVFDKFRSSELDKLAGVTAESSRLRRLELWFGKLTLDQLDSDLLDKWLELRGSGLLGSGRNNDRSRSPEKKLTLPKSGVHAKSSIHEGDGLNANQPPLTKHQRYSMKKRGAGFLVEQTVFPISTQTMRHELALLRRAIQSFFKSKKLLLEYGPWLQSQHVMAMKLPEAAAARTRRISDVEILSIVGKLPLKWESAIQLALCTTLRCSELVSLRWEDVNFITQTVLLRKPGHLKPSKTHTRDVPLLPLALAVLKQLGVKTTGKIFELSSSGLSQAWRRAADRAGIYDARFHDCRREAISRLVESCNIGLEKVVVFSGHSGTGALEKYYVCLSPSTIAKELSIIPGASKMLPAKRPQI